MTEIGNAFPTDPLAKALGLGKNLLPNSEGGPFKGKGNAGSAISSLPVPTPANPIGAASQDVLAEQAAFQKKNLAMKSFGDSVYAGNTGGYQPGQLGFPGGPTGAPASYKSR